MGELPGWYLDSLEQNLDLVVMAVRSTDITVEELAEDLINTQVQGGPPFPQEQVLAACCAILLRRLAKLPA